MTFMKRKKIKWTIKCDKSGIKIRKKLAPAERVFQDFSKYNRKEKHKDNNSEQ